jgi:hypothetical protein
VVELSLNVTGGHVFEVFRSDAEAPPPFDPEQDDPTDAHLEGFAFRGLGYLDARSWRPYLPRLIDYAFRRPDDPAMVTEALAPCARRRSRAAASAAMVTGCRCQISSRRAANV